MRPLRELILLLLIIFIISAIWLISLWSNGMLSPYETFGAMTQNLEDYGWLFLIVDFIIFSLIWRWIGYWKSQKDSVEKKT